MVPITVGVDVGVALGTVGDGETAVSLGTAVAVAEGGGVNVAVGAGVSLGVALTGKVGGGAGGSS